MPVPSAVGLMLSQPALEAGVAGDSRSLALVARVAAPLLLVKGPILVSLPELERWLALYPHKDGAFYLLHSFQFGFRIPYVGPRTSCMARFSVWFSYLLCWPLNPLHG